LRAQEIVNMEHNVLGVLGPGEAFVPSQEYMQLTEGYETGDGVRLFFQKLGTGPNPVIVPNAIHMFESFQHLAVDGALVFFDLRNRGRRRRSNAY
jgi:hypothetical protein